MSDEITNTPAGVNVDVDIDKPTPPIQDEDNGFLKTVPEGFADKPWVQELAKNENPLAEMFKQHEHQQSLIGKKAEGLKVPGEGATPEEWKSFHKAIGVPETIEGYTYEPPQVPDNLKEFFKPDDNLLGVMKNAALKAGIPPAGFKELAKEFDAYYLKELESANAKAKEAVTKIEGEFKTRYGERSPEVLQKWQDLSQMAPDWTKPVFESLPEVAKVALAAWADSISSKYIKEDKVDASNGSSEGVMTQAQYGDEYAKLYSALRQYSPGTVEHETAKQKLSQLRDKAGQIFAAR